MTGDFRAPSGERLQAFIEKTLTEFKMMEHELLDVEKFGDYGLENLGRISVEMRKVHESIAQDVMNGKAGVVHLIRTVFNPHQTLVQDLIESGSFPELAKLEEECR